MTELIEAPQAVKPINHWIGGKRHEGGSGRVGPGLRPGDRRPDRRRRLRLAEEIDLAVAGREGGVPRRGARSRSARRAELFFRIRELFHAHREDLARLLTAEHGKVLTDAMGEVARGLEVIEFCCGIPTLLKGGYSEQASTGVDVYSMRQPLGVVAGITPFNFPAMVPMWMWAPALACGNTFVLKPSEKDPSASMLTAELLAEAGVPDGVFNVVHGDKVAVDSLLAPPGHRRDLVRRLDPDRPLRLRDGDRERQALPGARRGEEPHDRAARRRHRHGRRRGRLGRLRLGGRALHGRLDAGRGRRDRRRPRRGDQGADPRREGGAGPRAGRRDGAARDPRAPRPRRLLRRARAAARARRSSSTGARACRPGTASSSGRR